MLSSTTFNKSCASPLSPYTLPPRAFPTAGLILPGTQHHQHLHSATAVWWETWGPLVPLHPQESRTQQFPRHSQPQALGQDLSCLHCPPKEPKELDLVGSRDAWDP